MQEERSMRGEEFHKGLIKYSFDWFCCHYQLIMIRWRGSAMKKEDGEIGEGTRSCKSIYLFPGDLWKVKKEFILDFNRLRKERTWGYVRKLTSSLPINRLLGEWNLIFI